MIRQLTFSGLLLMVLLACSPERPETTWPVRQSSLLGKQVKPQVEDGSTGLRLVVAERTDARGTRWIQLDDTLGSWEPATEWKPVQGLKGQIATH